MSFQSALQIMVISPNGERDFVSFTRAAETWSGKKYAEHNRQLLLRDEFIILGKSYDLLQRTGETQVKVVPQKSSHSLRILNQRGRNRRVQQPEATFPAPPKQVH
jgi:hypothetical protein